MITFFRGIAAALLLVFAAAALPASAQELQVRDIVKGTGDEANVGSTITVHYTGWLEDGTMFDSSRERGQPLEFTPGTGRVIRGWEQGVIGMRVGGKRELIIPPELAYGSQGVGDVIPPNATLRFEVELLSVKEPKFSSLDNAGLREKLEEGATVVDIRRPDEWNATGVLKGSNLLTFFDEKGQVNPDFLTDLSEIAGKGDEIVLICQRGVRSLIASRLLSERLEYSNISHVSAGISRWIDEGNPVVGPQIPDNCWLC